MKKIHINTKKALFYTSIVAVSAAPIAIVVSCGESSGSTTVVTSKYRDELASILAKTTYFGTNAISTNTRPQVVPLDPIAKEYKYLSGDYASVSAAKAAPEDKWQVALPSEVSFEKASRRLWLRVTLRTRAELGTTSSITDADLQSLEGDKKYFELTDSSKIKEIKSDFTQLPEYNELSLSGIALGGTLENPTLDVSGVKLPDGMQLEFLINSVTVPQDNFLNYITTNKDTMTGAILASTKARVAVKNPNLYVLSTPKEEYIVSDIPFIVNVDSLVTALRSVKADLSTSNTLVTWQNVPGVIASKPSSVDKVEYYIGTEATAEALQANTAVEWSNTIPNSVAATHTSRNLWVKLTPVTGEIITSPIINLTDTSDIRKVKTLITPTTTNLASMSLGGVLTALVINNLVTAPLNAHIEFQLKNNWYTSADLITFARDHASEITTQDLGSVRARYAVDNASLYKLSNSYETAIANNSKILFAPPALLNTSLGNLKAATISTSTAVTWEKTTELEAAKPAEITSITYYYGTLATVAAVAAATNITWSASPPTSVSSTHTDRHLFAKLTPSTQYALAAPIIDITDSSGIQRIKVLVTVPVMPLNTIAYKFVDGVATIDTKGITFPGNTEPLYQFNFTGAWRKQSDFITYLNSLDASVPLASYQNVKVSVGPISDLYSVDNARETAIQFTYDSYREKLIKYFAKLTFFTPESVSTAGVAAPITVDPIASSYQYSTSEYLTAQDAANAPATAWTSSLPTTVAFDRSTRNLWVKVNVKSQAQLSTTTTIKSFDLSSLSGNDQYINISTASGIRNIKSDIAQQAGFSTYTLTGATLTGTLDAPVLNLNSLTPFARTQFIFTIGDRTADSETALVDLIKELKATIRATPTILQGVKIKLTVIDSDYYVLRSPVEAAVTSSIATS